MVLTTHYSYSYSYSTAAATTPTTTTTTTTTATTTTANQEDLTLGATSRWSGDGTIITGVRLWPAAVGLASVLERRSRSDPTAFSGVQAPLCPAMPRSAAHALYRHHSAIHHTSCTPPRQALELGAGVGVSGIVLAELGARVTLTDCFPPILALLRRNVAQNAGGGLARPASVQP